MRRAVLGLILAAGLCVVVEAVHSTRAVHAESGGRAPATQIGNPQDNPQKWFRGPVGQVSDGSNLDTILADATNPEFGINGRTTVAFYPIFSQIGQTCGVRFVTYSKVGTDLLDTSISDIVTATTISFPDYVRSGTINGGAVTVTGHRGLPVSFDARGAYFGKIIIESPPAAGTVTFGGSSW